MKLKNMQGSRELLQRGERKGKDCDDKTQEARFMKTNGKEEECLSRELLEKKKKENKKEEKRHIRIIIPT